MANKWVQFQDKTNDFEESFAIIFDIFFNANTCLIFSWFFGISGCHCRQWRGGKIQPDPTLLSRSFYKRLQKNDRRRLSWKAPQVKTKESRYHTIWPAKKQVQFRGIFFSHLCCLENGPHDFNFSHFWLRDILSDSFFANEAWPI